MGIVHASHQRRFGQYEAAFRDSRIDDEVLRKLTADDLKDLGVAKILIAIPESVAFPSSLGCRAPAAAERRQLTALFCDLAGSTAMSARLDPEDMRGIIRAYRDVCSGVICPYDGFITKFMSDGVITYFGFPVPSLTRSLAGDCSIIAAGSEKLRMRHIAWAFQLAIMNLVFQWVTDQNI